MKTIELRLWISNQTEGAGCDCTTHYIEAADWVPPAGVTLDADAQMLTGEAEATWAAYRSLAAAVAEVGHGTDFDGDEIEEIGEPILTACPRQLICDGWTSAGESLARLESPEHETWGSFVTSIPSLAAELAEA